MIINNDLLICLYLSGSIFICVIFICLIMILDNYKKPKIKEGDIFINKVSSSHDPFRRDLTIDIIKIIDVEKNINGVYYIKYQCFNCLLNKFTGTYSMKSSSLCRYKKIEVDYFNKLSKNYENKS